MKLYETYKDSEIQWIGNIPSHWKVISFKRLFSFGRGLAITKSDLVDEGMPVISYGQIHSKSNSGTKIEKDLLRYVPNSFTENNESSKVYKGDFIFADTSEDLDGCGNCVYIDTQTLLYAGYHSIIARSLHNDDNKYLAYLFKTPCWRSQIRSSVNGVKVFSITQNTLAESKLILPSSDEQKIIASYLDYKVGQIDKVIAEKETMLGDIKNYRSAVINEAVTKGLNKNSKMIDSGISWLGKIPSHWDVVPLKFNLSLKGRIGWNGLKSDEFKEKSYAYLVTGQDFDRAEIDWSKCYQIDKERYDEDPFIQLSNGDLLVTKDGTIGKVAKVSNLDKPACLNSGIFVVKQIKDAFIQDFLYWTFVSSQLANFNNFNNTGSTIQHLYQNVFENMPLLVPSKEEQKAIAAYLNNKVTQIDVASVEIQSQIEDLKSYKSTIIAEAVTGKVDLRGWNNKNVKA